MNAQDLDMIIGHNLRRIRLEKGLSQEKIGNLINNAKTKISAIENGKEGLGKDLLTKICNALKIRPSEFYIEPDTPIIVNENEKLHLQKYREAEQLEIANEISLFTQYAIDKANNEKNKSHPDKSHKKSNKLQKKEM